MRNNGKLTRRQIKGILETHGKSANARTELEAFVPDSDINAIMRRMDNDGDEELSFADYFSSLLPYFIYGELREKPSKNAVVSQKIRSRERSVNKTRKTINLSVSRAKSASAGQRRKPPSGQQNLWEKHPTLLADDDFDEEEYIGLRSGRGGQSNQKRESACKPQMRPDASGTNLFSQENPALYFHKSPAKGKPMPDLGGRHNIPDTTYARMNNPISPGAESADEYVRKKKNMQNMTSE